MAGLLDFGVPVPSFTGDGGLSNAMTKPVFSAAGQGMKDMWMKYYEEELTRFRTLPSNELAAYGRQIAHAQKVGNGENPRLQAAIAAYTTAMDERRPQPGLLGNVGGK